MPRRWIAALACLAALVALACDGEGSASPRPSGSAPPGAPKVLTALGDSVTTGFGSCLVLVSCERNSWSSGDGIRVHSLYRRLRDDNPTLRAYNRAVPGSRAAGLTDQARAAVRDRADLVTVLIGANDACRDDIAGMTPVATFRKQVDAALAVLRKGRPKARVLVVSLPDLHRLWEIGHTESRAVRAWSRGICPALLADATSTAPAAVARRARFRERIDAYDGQLRAACRAYGSRCRWDGGAVHRTRFSLDEVNALDWFHPNAAGQDRLADVTWDASGWAD
ncbi:GDSL-type esterase/lipase family protein [Micromonospora sp. A3M-1-15]|uniref:GDSL-type esterase/lipase family protein n=1 Tax=Micromonospora sp. A3M-1-15 TaxID=2962035 RepID=UPI0020B8F289|nr:GDSL-type esterase/lipase family protein [Micromonospora sp. A3M-1-15]MCP3781997.1 GDSL-type esterase/lipase family protein [Micromonospora sp. A3M-1-15]